MTKSIAELFETLMVIHQSLSHRSRSLRYVSRYFTSSAGYDGRVVHVESQLDVVEIEGMSFTYRLNRMGEIIPP
jgi:hypothetical protein